MSKDPLETRVSEGFAKLHEAGELISEEQVKELAEKASKDAEESKQQHLKKHEQ